MKKTFCDKCGNEMTEKENTHAGDCNFEVSTGGGAVVLVIAQPQERPEYKYDDLCITCFFDVFSKYDIRPAT